MRIAALLLLVGSLGWAAARTVGDGERRTGPMWVIGGAIDLLPGSRVDGDLWLFGGEARIDGLLIGDVIAPFGTVRFGPMAVVRGRVWADVVERHPDALLTRPAAAPARIGGVAAVAFVLLAGAAAAALRFARRARRRF